VIVVCVPNTAELAAVNAVSEQVTDVILLTVSDVPNTGCKSK
jgi:hypothetical protein